MTWVPLAGGRADLERQVVERDDGAIHLTTKERDLIAYFAQRPGVTVTRTELLVEVWKRPTRASEEPIYSAVKRLRAKIDRGDHQHLVSVHGDGYRWVPPPAPASIAPKPSARPQPATDRFFGRSAEREAATAALGQRGGVVTLVGPGGVGKTRLALEIAAGRDHVFCDLSTALDASSVIARMSAALDVPLVGSDPTAWTRALGQALASLQPRLLVLDNLEQIAEPVAELLTTWSAALPPTVATSRESLRVRGERVIAVGPLAEAEAVELLDDRLVAAGGAAADRTVTAAIVVRLDRLPLSIELAAAQAAAVGAEAVLASLGDALGTLVAGRRDAPARHATLRAAVEWSWAFLAHAERDALVDLATFEGAFDLDGARAVVAAEDAAALVAALCRRSQLHRDGDRFQLYAAVRELAREQHRPAAAEARHVEHFARRGGEALALRDGRGHAAATAWLERELAELRSALERTLATPREARGDALVVTLARCVDAALAHRGGAIDQRRDLLARARAAVEEPEALAALGLQLALLPGAPLALVEIALRELASPALRAEAGLALGQRLAPQDTAAARRVLHAALDDARTAGAERTRGRITACLGETAWLEGAVDEARRGLGEGLAIHDRERDDRALAATAALLAHLDRVEIGEGAAHELLRRASESAERLGDPLVVARVALDRGQHLARTGDQSGARAALDDAIRAYDRVGFVRERALAHLHLAETLVGIGQLDRALEAAQRTLSDLDEGDVARSTVHEAIACIHLLSSRTTLAAQWLERGLALARERGAARSECTLLGKRGLLHFVEGRAARAWEDFDLAVRKNEARGSTAITAASLVDRAMAARASGRATDAQADLDRARELLGDLPEHRAEGRMLVVCEAAGRAFAAVAEGSPPTEVGRRLRAETARIFERVPESEWDVVLRFLDWLVTRVARLPAPREAPAARRPARVRTPRRSRS